MARANNPAQRFRDKQAKTKKKKEANKAAHNKSQSKKKAAGKSTGFVDKSGKAITKTEHKREKSIQGFSGGSTLDKEGLAAQAAQKKGDVIRGSELAGEREAILAESADANILTPEVETPLSEEDRGEVVSTFTDATGAVRETREGDLGAAEQLEMLRIGRDATLRAQGLKPLDEMMVYQQALLAIATLGAGGVVRRPSFLGTTTTEGAIAAGQAQQTAVEKSLQVGTEFKPVIGNAASTYAANGKTLSKTLGFLTGSGRISLGAAGIFTTAVGTYPFAGFIKEEALQTLSFATRTAAANKDAEGMRAALDMQQEILDGQHAILSKIPYANVLVELNAFFDAARLKVGIDEEGYVKLLTELARERIQP